jgi:hypothetical protein
MVHQRQTGILIPSQKYPYNPYNKKTKNSNTSSKGCFRCGDPNHYKRECPLNGTPNPAADNARVMNRGSKESKDGRVYLRMKLNGQPIDCLLDSDCELTLMPLSVIKQHRGIKIQPTEKRVYAANQTEIELAGEVTIPLQLDDQCLRVKSLVSHDIEEVMLGVDFLQDHDCVWHFKESQILIKGKSYCLFAKKGSHRCRRVYCTTDTIIAPHQQANIAARATLTSTKAIGQNWATEAHTLQPGVYVGRTAVPAAHHGIAIRVVNTTSEPRMIRKDAYMGTLNPISLATGEAQVECTTPIKLASQTIIDSLPNDLTDEQRETATNLARTYEDIFSQNDYDIGCTHLVEHEINTGDHRPIRQALRRHPLAHLEVIDEEVNALLRHGIIEPAASAWASNLVLIRKKDGSLRMCVDYRNLNAVTCQDTYPLPHIDNCLNTLQGSSWFSTLDLRSGKRQG